jgi:hypothetical protein
MLISLGGVTGGLCARSCASGATRNSTRAAQIGRMAHGLTSEQEMVQDFLLIQEEIQKKRACRRESKVDSKLNG